MNHTDRRGDGDFSQSDESIREQTEEMTGMLERSRYNRSAWRERLFGRRDTEPKEDRDGR